MMDYRLLILSLLAMALSKISTGQRHDCSQTNGQEYRYLLCDLAENCTKPTHAACRCNTNSGTTMYVTAHRCYYPCLNEKHGCEGEIYCNGMSNESSVCACNDRYTYDSGVCKAITCDQDKHMTCLNKQHCTKQKEIPESCVCMPMYENINGTCQAITCDHDKHMTCLNKQHCTMQKENAESCVCMPMYENINGTCQEIVCKDYSNMKCLKRSDCGKESQRESDDCVCMEGYEKDTDRCININECTETDDEGNPIHGCDAVTQDCTDTEGSYTCTCKDGYRGDEKQCHPIFHCGRMEGACKNNGTCVMSTGMCSCTEGYQLYDCSVETAKVSSDCNTTCENNGVCTERMNCHCKPGFTGETCSDKTVRLDECNVDNMITTIVVQKGAANAQLMYIADSPNGHCDYKITSDEGTFVTKFENDDENCTNTVRRKTHENNQMGYTIKVLVQYNPDFQSKLDEVHVFTCIDDMASYSNFNLHNWKDLDEYYKNIINGKNNEVGHVPFEMSILDSEKEDITSPVYLGDQVYLVFSIKDDSKHKYIKARPDTCTFYGKERSGLDDNQKTDSAYSLKAIENKCPSKAAKTVLYKKFMEEEEDGDDSDNSTTKTLVPFNVFQFSKSTDLYVYCTVKVCQRASDKQCTAEECKKSRRKRETRFIYRNSEAKAHLKIRINPRVRLYEEPNTSVMNTATFLTATVFTLAASAITY